MQAPVVTIKDTLNHIAMKRQFKKLQLHRTTLTNLTAAAMQLARGGIVGNLVLQPIDADCPTHDCSLQPACPAQTKGETCQTSVNEICECHTTCVCPKDTMHW
jgi:hypothetical protein